MNTARRFRYMFSSLGWTVADVAKFLQVSVRTVQLWCAGKVRVPYAAYKLLRLQLRYELPGDAWNGWAISAGRLYTPEGYELRPQDFNWWSLLVRRAAMFSVLYARQSHGAGSGLVPSINNVETGQPVEHESQQNQGLARDITHARAWHQFDHGVISQCPIRYAFRLNSTPKPDSRPSDSESASMRLSPLPLMPTSGACLPLPQQSHLGSHQPPLRGAQSSPSGTRSSQPSTSSQRPIQSGQDASASRPEWRTSTTSTCTRSPLVQMPSRSAMKSTTRSLTSSKPPCSAGSRPSTSETARRPKRPLLAVPQTAAASTRRRASRQAAAASDAAPSIDNVERGPHERP